MSNFLEWLPATIMQALNVEGGKTVAFKPEARADLIEKLEALGPETPNAARLLVHIAYDLDTKQEGATSVALELLGIAHHIYPGLNAEFQTIMKNANDQRFEGIAQAFAHFSGKEPEPPESDAPKVKVSKLTGGKIPG